MLDGAERIRIVIADDHPLYRASVVRAIAHHPRIEVVAQTNDGRSALDEIRRLEPEVAILDMFMPALDGAAVLNAVTRDDLPTRVILLSGALDDTTVYGALERGAAAVMTKTAEADEIVDTILAVARGDVVLAPELQSIVARQIQMRAKEDRPILTPREREILDRMAQGMSGPQIAGDLHLSPSTVKSHTERLYEKLGVADRGAAVAVGMRQGLIE
jgi:two-component system, NarL family, nitrate/nitrite response regulator NarL